VIRLLIVDDHPAMRAGLTAVLRAEPGMVPVASLASHDDLAAAVSRTEADVVLLDCHAPGDDALRRCRRLKAAHDPPAVLLHVAYEDESLLIPAALAGADGLITKSAPADELFDAVRSVARGDRSAPPVSRQLLGSAGEALTAEQLPVLAMMLDGTPPDEVAETLRTTPESIARLVDDMLDRLRGRLASAA